MGFRGYQVSVDCSVGSLERGDESETHDGLLAEAVREIAAAAPSIAKAFAHFATATHPFTLTRHVLDREAERAPEDASPFASAEWFGLMQIHPFLTTSDEPIARKVRADLVLSQLTNPDVEGPATCIWEEGSEKNLLSDVSLHLVSLLQARTCRDRITAFVKAGGDPETPSALANGKILLGILSGEPPSPEEVLRPLVERRELERVGCFYADAIPAAKAARLAELHAWTTTTFSGSRQRALKQHAEALAKLAAEATGR